MTQGITNKSRGFLQDIHILYRGLTDPEVPWYVKAVVGLMIAYLISPIDLIPDFIPVLGLLDEAVLIPLAVKFAIRLMPKEQLAKYRDLSAKITFNKKLVAMGVGMVLLCWLGLILLVWLLLRDVI